MGRGGVVGVMFLFFIGAFLGAMGTTGLCMICGGVVGALGCGDLNSGMYFLTRLLLLGARGVILTGICCPTGVEVSLGEASGAFFGVLLKNTWKDTVSLQTLPGVQPITLHK